MREIKVQELIPIIRDMSIAACIELDEKVVETFKLSLKKEESEVGRSVLNQLLKNSEIARTEKIPICQDTGFTVIYLEVGQEVMFVGGSLTEAINEGVRQGYTDGYLRKSIVEHPLLEPKNTMDNTPAIIHTDIVPGDKVKITILPKGGGSENMSRLKMMKPADGVEGVKNFVIETVRMGAVNACPPISIGVGIGGTFDYVAYLAKKALLRGIGTRNKDEKIAKLEEEWLTEVNKVGIGPGGLGGRVTVLDLFIEEYPRHIATFPVAVNIQCHAYRMKSYTL